MGLSPAPLNLWPLAWVALVPLWVFIVQPETKPKKNRLIYHSICGLFWGIGYHGLALFWFTGIHPMTSLGVPWLASFAIALFCWIFITLWGAALVSIWAVIQSWVSQRISKQNDQRFHSLIVSRVLIGTALWCGLEGLWSAGPLWWSSLSYTQSPHNLLILHLGQLSGPNTITAVIVAVNGLIAEYWIFWRQSYTVFSDNRTCQNRIRGNPYFDIAYLNDKPNNKESLFLSLNNLPLILAVCLFLGSHSIGFYLWNLPLIQMTGTALKVGIIQGNISNDIKFNSEGWRRALAGYTSGYRTLADRGVDAVLIPETALPYLWTAQTQRSSSFYQAILEKKVVAWVGSFGMVNQGQSIVRDYTNSLFTVTGNGQTFSRYDKTHLVPLGEYIPFEKYIGGWINRLSPLDAHLVAGSPDQILETPFGRAIVGICFDSPFAEHFRRQAAAGGEFILTASNDAHYHTDIMWQHHALEVMRAIETDRWAVRATNTGLSAIVDPHGKTHWHSQINHYDLYADTIYRRTTKTLYVLWGDLLTPLLLLLGAIVGVLITRFG